MIASLHVARRIRAYGDELPGADVYLFCVYYDCAAAAENGVNILGSIVDVVVLDGFRARRKFNLIETERADTESVSYTLIVRTCGRVRAGRGMDRSDIDDSVRRWWPPSDFGVGWYRQPVWAVRSCPRAGADAALTTAPAATVS